MQNEELKLSQVTDVIIEKISSLTEGLAGKRAEVLDTHTAMWKEARTVLRDFDDVADLSVFTEDLAQSQKQYAHTSVELNKLKKILGSPYFARIDFLEDGEQPEQIYIGRHSVYEDKKLLYHVYDWRAPISSLYYDHGVGRASFFVPGTGAEIEGEISLKRQYQIEKGKLVYMFDNELAVDDEILRRELSKASDAHIKTIINTIQAEQNRAIRADASHVLVLGAAGSGKTSVGLHRLAYLLYRDRDSLTSAKVRIFSPSAVFSSYIEGIIPELGEEDVLNLDFPSLLEMQNSRPFFGLYEQIDYLTTAKKDATRRNWLRHKCSPAFLDALETSVAGYSPVFEDVTFIQDIVCPKERLSALYQDRTAASNLSGKTNRVTSYVHQAYEEYFKANRDKITAFYDNLHDDTFSDDEIRSKFDQEKSIVFSDLFNRLQPTARRLYERHLQNWAKEHGLEMKINRDALKMEKLYYEDALALMYTDILIGRIKPDKSVRHILLDEAQDLSHLHHRILKRMYTASHFTVLADTNQALYSEINITNPSELTSLYPQANLFKLEKSYRSTYEITNFAAKFLPKSVMEPGVFARHGQEPAIIKTQNPYAAILDILAELPGDFMTAGVLLPTDIEAKAFHKQLKSLWHNPARPVQLISGETHTFAPGVMVMAVPYAKGLEFDAVICPAHNAPALQGADGHKLMYLICTRALHRLYLLEH